MNLKTWFAEGAFIDRQRIVNYNLILIGVYLVASIWMISKTSSAGLDYMGRPIGTDFSNVWSAGVLAAEGSPLAIYDPPVHFEKQREIFYDDVPLYGWHYPPMFLLVARGLAEIPYMVALALYMSLTFLFYLFSIYKLLPRKETLVVASGFPAVFLCLGHGQNAFLTGALLALLFGEMKRRPKVAGFALGILTYKPQFGFLIPLALLVNRRWSVFATALIVTVALVSTTWLFWGTELWIAFLSNGSFTKDYILESGATGWEKIQSVFSALRMLGATINLAYIGQGLSAIIAALLTVRTWTSRVPIEVKGSVVIVATLMVTPYFLDYDLVVLAIPIALMTRLGLNTGFRPFEKSTLVALWVLPLVCRVVGQISIPLTPLFLSLFLMVLWQGRIKHSGKDSRVGVSDEQKK